MTTVGSGKYTYTLEENWAHLPEGMTMGNASAVATDSQDRVYVFQRKDPPVLIFGSGGNYLGSWGLRAIDEAHGIYIQDDIVYHHGPHRLGMRDIHAGRQAAASHRRPRRPLRHRLRGSGRGLPALGGAVQLPHRNRAGAQRRPVRL